MEHQSNVVGDTVRRWRYQKNWTQETLSARCSVRGVEITRGTLAKIEAGIRGVSDAELYVLARALKLDMTELFPPAFKQKCK
ncbi:MAG: helix-turn-helix domain-containing protein [Verrucomicrobiales bacterium]|jgi:transcriptional regulator with XRE-family HTH domain|nr:helix-turn-helix domain-containing protein [Verrucomicrobiales bacterium]